MLMLSENAALTTSLPFIFDGNPENTIAFVFDFRVWAMANDFLTNTSLFRKIVGQLESNVAQALSQYIAQLKSEWLANRGVTREKVRATE